MSIRRKKSLKGFQLIKPALITDSWLWKCHDTHLITTYACARGGVGGIPVYHTAWTEIPFCLRFTWWNPYVLPIGVSHQHTHTHTHVYTYI